MELRSGGTGTTNASPSSQAYLPHVCFPRTFWSCVGNPLEALTGPLGEPGSHREPRASGKATQTVCMSVGPTRLGPAALPQPGPKWGWLTSESTCWGCPCSSPGEPEAQEGQCERCRMESRRPDPAWAPGSYGTGPARSAPCLARSRHLTRVSRASLGRESRLWRCSSTSRGGSSQDRALPLL